ncbi:response regulator, partial [Oceaniglobus roseus]|uniref:response regulator n=1 Tax=Oceaniglobus roseus TaxID=1737570 RepID=UPI0012FFF451
GAALSLPVSRRALAEALAAAERQPSQEGVRDRPGASPTAPATPSAGDGTAGGERRIVRVLAAEDNKTNRLVFSRMLKDAGIALRVAGNGAEAVDLYRAEPPDVIFMDISMPGMDGREATRRIRAFEAESGLPRVPIHAMTAHALHGDAEEILATGMDSHMTKPLAKADLVAVIEATRARLGPAGAAGCVPEGGPAQEKEESRLEG